MARNPDRVDKTVRLSLPAPLWSLLNLYRQHLEAQAGRKIRTGELCSSMLALLLLASKDHMQSRGAEVRAGQLQAALDRLDLQQVDQVLQSLQHLQDELDGSAEDEPDEEPLEQ